MIINLISWIVLGAIAGWLAGYIVSRDTKLDIMDIVLGILGAVAGGWLSRLLLDYDFNTFSIVGVVVAVIGALILTFLWKLVKGRS